MARSDVEMKLQAVADSLVNELISITPGTMSEIQFEIVSTPDGGADIGLLENHPDAKNVALSAAIYDYSSQYLPLIKQYVPGWRRSLIVLQESEGAWQVSMKFESE